MYLAILEDGNGDKANAKTSILKAANFGQISQQLYDSIMLW